MMRVVVVLLSVFAMMAVASPAFAKCYRFSKADSGVYVCVGKNGADSFSDRKAAKKICDEKQGKDCGSVGSSSSSCHSNQNKCYDENGKAHRSLKDY